MLKLRKNIALILILFLLFATFVSIPVIADDNNSTGSTTFELKKIYEDADAISPWAYDAISRAAQMGLLDREAKRFRPTDNITRAEFTQIMVKALDLDENIPNGITFSDVREDDWFYSTINAAYNAGFIGGYDNQFLPDAAISREQMAAILTKALKVSPKKSATSINDYEQISPWARRDVETIFAMNLMVGHNNNFNSQDFTTREAASVIALRAYDYNQNQKIEKESQLDKPEEEGLKSEINSKESVKSEIQRATDYLYNMVKNPVIASIGGEWTVLTLARSGLDFPDSYYQKYYSNVEKTLKEEAGKLHRVKYTEYSRVILALTAIGRDIKNVAGYDLREPLADFNTVIIQGINGPIFALIALNTDNYEIPIVEGVEVQTTREKLIDFILGREIRSGGWELGPDPKNPDPDITAMAIQGLAPYYVTNPKVKEAVDRGVNWLSKAQASDGGYYSWGSLNSESCAQVIVALTSLGIDPHKDPRFIKNGNSLVDNLLSYIASNGGFYHVKPGGEGNGGANPGEVDLMATDQGTYALVAYQRFLEEKNTLYNMTDVKKR